MKNRDLWLLITIVVVFATFLLIVNILNLGLSNDWVGFSGGLIGSFIGVFGVYWTMKMDQKKREEERREEFFIQSLNVYIDLITLLDKSSLHTIFKELSKFQKSNNWYLVDRDTKKSIEKIIVDCGKGNEIDGCENALRSYIYHNCKEELSLNITEYHRQPDVTIKDNVFSRDAAEDLLEIVMIERYDLIYFSLDFSELLGTVEEFKKKIPPTSRLNELADQIENIYYCILDFPNSEQWNTYTSERQIAFNVKESFKKALIHRVENVQ